MNLIEKCRKISINCLNAEQFCRTKACRARRHSNVTRGVGVASAGTLIGTAIAVGLGFLVFVGFVTFRIATLVCLAIFVALVCIGGIGTGAIAHVAASYFKEVEKTFKQFTQQFDDSGSYAFKVHSFTLKVCTALQKTRTFVEGIQLYDYDCHDMSRCQDELLHLHQVAINMHKKNLINQRPIEM